MTQTSLSISKWPSVFLIAFDRAKPGSDLSFDFGRARARGEAVTAHASTHGTRAAVNFWVDTPTSGSRRGFVPEGLHLSDRRVDCGAAARDLNASYHLAVVASDVLLDSELSEQSSSIKAFSLPLPPGEHRTNNLRTLLPCCNKPNLVLCVRSSGCMCLVCGASLAQLGTEFVEIPLRLLPRGVWKKSASVVARDSALLPFFTCFSGTSVFSRECSLMASLYTVSDSTASWLLFFFMKVALPPPPSRAPEWLLPWPHKRHHSLS